MDEKYLVEMINAGSSIADIANDVGKSKTSVRHWLKKYGLKTQGKFGGRQKGNEGMPIVDGKKECTKCKRLLPVEEYNVRKSRNNSLTSQCKSCGAEAVIARQRKIKSKCVRYMDSKCVDCGVESIHEGYDYNLGMFEFHHTEPEHKDFSISEKKTQSFVKLTDELDKCVLLCGNCHVKRHVKMREKVGYTNKIAGNSERHALLRIEKLLYACDGDIRCSTCDYSDSTAMVISFSDADKEQYTKYNRNVENWSDDYKRALRDATVTCTNCFMLRKQSNY